MATKKKATRVKEPEFKGIKIPTAEYNIIKAYVAENNHKLGRFVSQAAIEKIENSK